ncbi:MAG: hypothetical protein GQ546_12045 [Gammaproteobacteria bacterium]|nr:hypothetical protein [Gammaproteobacteria bacterium]
MDFKFRKNIDGQPTAKFSMEHEAIGRWLTEEISNNKSKIVQILTLIEQFEQGSIAFKEIIGTEFQLSISHIGVEIKALNLEADYMDNFNNNEFSGNDDDRSEDAELYDKESYAECGLHDFKIALLSWQEYIN